MSRIASIINDPLAFLYTLPGIIIGITVHEWAHAFSAYKLGDPTARDMGRMTLNPLDHIDLFGFLCLLLVGFGWAKPVPVNPRNFKNYKRDDIIVSLAGIAMNLIVAFVATVLFVLIGYGRGLIGNVAFTRIMQSIIAIDLSLAVFNLIPISPLDGSHLFEILFIRRFPKVVFFLRKYGRYILYALILLGATSGLISRAVNAIYGVYLNAALAIAKLVF